MQKKFQKSYSLSTEIIHRIELAAKKDKRNPSDFLDVFLSEKLPDPRSKKKKSE